MVYDVCTREIIERRARRSARAAFGHGLGFFTYGLHAELALAFSLAGRLLGVMCGLPDAADTLRLLIREPAGRSPYPRRNRNTRHRPPLSSPVRLTLQAPEWP